MKKHCPRCNKDLPHDSFTKDRSRKDGLRSYCRECYNSYLRENRASWKSRSPEARHQEWKRYIESNDNYYTEKANRDARYRENNKHKISARAKTYNAYREQQQCSIDGCNEWAERHHLSYQDPDKFIWLCRKHHIAEHKK